MCAPTEASKSPSGAYFEYLRNCLRVLPLVEAYVNEGKYYNAMNLYQIVLQDYSNAWLCYFLWKSGVHMTGGMIEKVPPDFARLDKVMRPIGKKIYGSLEKYEKFFKENA